MSKYLIDQDKSPLFWRQEGGYLCGDTALSRCQSRLSPNDTLWKYVNINGVGPSFVFFLNDLLMVFVVFRSNIFIISYIKKKWKKYFKHKFFFKTSNLSIINRILIFFLSEFNCKSAWFIFTMRSWSSKFNCKIIFMYTILVSYIQLISLNFI